LLYKVKSNKDQLLVVRITTEQQNALKRISKKKRTSIPQLIRAYIETEELKLIESEYDQATLFARTAEEEQQYLNRVVNLFTTISQRTGRVLIPAKKVRPGKVTGRVKRRKLIAYKKAKQKGVRLNE